MAGSIDAYVTSIETFVMNNQILVAVGVAFVALLIYAYKNGAFSNKDLQPYEKTTLEERVVPDLKERVLSLGISSDKDLNIGGYNKIGEVSKYMQAKMPTNELISADGMEKEQDLTDVMVFLIGETGMKKYLWYLTDVVLGKSFFSNIVVVEKDSVESTGEAFNISEEAEFANRAGIIMQRTNACQNVTNDVAVSDALEVVANNIAEYAERVNYFDRRTSSEIQRMEKLDELDKQGVIDEMRGH